MCPINHVQLFSQSFKNYQLIGKNQPSAIQLESKIMSDPDAALEFVKRLCNTKSCNQCEKILAFYDSFPELIQRGCRAILGIPMCCRNASKIFSTGFWKFIFIRSLIFTADKSSILSRESFNHYLSVIPFKGKSNRLLAKVLKYSYCVK